MRVITGSARAVKLFSPQGLTVRPTSERVKEAVFSIIQFDIESRKVLDLFAGSGQMGIEALSRGASHAVFIDTNPDSINTVKANLKKTKLADKASVLSGEALSYLKSSQEFFDIAFVDPPYNDGIYIDTLALLVKRMNKGGTILCEAPYKEELPKTVEDFTLIKEYHYSHTKIALYRTQILQGVMF